MRTSFLVATALLGFTACPKSNEPPEFDPSTDRTLQKLKAEQERLAKQGRPVQAPPVDDPLTAAIERPIKPENLGIPSGVEADLGPVTLFLVEVTQSQSVSSSKATLTTADRFLKVTLEARASKSTTLDLSAATLTNKDTTVTIARDVQHVAPGSPLSMELTAGSTTRLELYFEVPPALISKGLKIILTHGESRVELPLQ